MMEIKTVQCGASEVLSHVTDGWQLRAFFPYLEPFNLAENSDGSPIQSMQAWGYAVLERETNKSFDDCTMANALLDVAARLEFIVPISGHERERLFDARDLLQKIIQQLLPATGE